MNRQQRRVRQRQEKRFNAALKRYKEEGRYSMEAELILKHGVSSWDELTEDERMDILEQLEQAKNQFKEVK